MAVMRLSAALLLCLAVTSFASEVHELNEAANDGKAPIEDGSWPSETWNDIPKDSQGAAEGAKDTWGQRQGAKDLNMPGAPYGKPGYKESHNWESAVDTLSPVVFNWKFYKAAYSDELEDKDEAGIKDYWINTANAEDKKYPDCDQASPSFSANMYYRAQEQTGNSLPDDSCLAIVKDFLASGIYTGKATASAAAEDAYQNTLSGAAADSKKGRLVMTSEVLKKKGGVQSGWPIGDINKGDVSPEQPPAAQFSVAFKLKIPAMSDALSNILTLSYPIAEGIRVSLPAQVDSLSVLVPMVSNGDFSCENTAGDDGYLNTQGEWNDIAIVVKENKVQIYANCNLAKECESTAGDSAMLPPTGETGAPMMGTFKGADDEPMLDGTMSDFVYSSAALQESMVKYVCAQPPTYDD